MRILIIGGGPGGLYSALLLKKDDSTRDITLLDRNPSDATYGWGIVFSEQTLASFEKADPASYHDITSQFVKWDAIDVHYRGQVRPLGRARLCRYLEATVPQYFTEALPNSRSFFDGAAALK